MSYLSVVADPLQSKTRPANPKATLLSPFPVKPADRRFSQQLC